ncbi:MAG TPA: serine/threonine-protein kinase [Candidatus Paceibacterota bacterium]|nr:serine/threonine-protein kinase [Verrucomicrobiota bacterium]HSA10522.1 serine/threonine-protein kinase [Candidatus Paceibacterota bacterium]
MSENASKCQRCGAELPPGPKAGPCPRCAAQFLQATQTEALGEPSGPRPRFTPPPVTELASLFPQLEILELVGQGGMGAVYKARQKELDRIVALKILPPDIGQDPSFAERFAREAKALARLNHPGIVTLYEFGRAGGDTSRETAHPQPLYYFLMEFVHGVNLRRVLEAGRMSSREALAIVPQICDALQYAHDQGIIHRDIKPENILLDRQGHVKVADFGLAKLVGTAEAASGEATAISPASTGAGTVMGTPQYMAPEQREHPTEVDHRADIYSLGVVFYQMLTGELPAAGKVEAPSKKVLVDARLDEVVLRTLEQEPERRYQQASRVKEDVETIASTSSGAHPPGGQAHSSASAAAIGKSRRGLQVPAIGLIISGVINVLLPIAATLSVGSHGGPIAMVVPIMLMAGMGGLVIVGGSRMLRLQAYGLSVAVSILAMITPPGCLLGVPFGVWALIVLTKKEVREAFRSGESVQPGTTPSQPIPTPRRVSATKSLLIAVVSLLLLVAVALGAFLFLTDRTPVLLTNRSRREAESARISAVNQRLAGEARSHLDAAGYAYREVQVAVYSPGFPGGYCTIIGLRRITEDSEVPGGLNLRHDGSGFWFFNGWGALSNVQFQVHAAYEMGLPLEQQLTFGPVNELVVTGAIDFDTGKLIDLPLAPSANDREPARYDWLNSAEGKAWMRERGIDALDANRALIRVDLLLIKLKDQEWNSLTADALAAKIRSQAPATDVFNTRINTYGFQTREGREGMLQVLNANLAQGVKIRYKLVDAARDFVTGRPFAAEPSPR